METFELGEKIIYPQFGLGKITELIEKQVHGAVCNFYRLSFPLKQMEILVPINRANENGLRRVISKEEAEELLHSMGVENIAEKPFQWHRWKKKVMACIKAGDPKELSRIYCHLQAQDLSKGLSYTERKILAQIEEILTHEIAEARQVNTDKARKLLHGAQRRACLKEIDETFAAKDL